MAAAGDGAAAATEMAAARAKAAAAVETAELRSPTLVLIGSVLSLLDPDAADAAVAEAAAAARALGAVGGCTPQGGSVWRAEDVLRLVGPQ